MSMDNKKVENSEGQPKKLDDASRIKTLSPGMMVAKRFFRNKLAIVGLSIIVAMFLFAFVGGAVCPYSESEVFYTKEQMSKKYAGVTEIKEFQYQNVDGVKLPKDVASKMILATTKKSNIVETRDGSLVGLDNVGNDSYVMFLITKTDKKLDTAAGYKDAVDNNRHSFTEGNKTYFFDDADGVVFYDATEAAIATKVSFTAYSDDIKFTYDFYRSAIIAMGKNESTFESEGKNYSVTQDGSSALISLDGKEYAFISANNFNAIENGVFLSPAYKMAAIEAINADAGKFTFADENGKDVEYTYENKNGQYVISSFKSTQVIDKYAKPSSKHWVGTDGNGMDLLARLMFGGRISLLIGFVVIFLEVFIGMVIGGIAGFFGGWVDNVLMRLVDIIYCIPSMPLYLILGSVMDYYHASSTFRIYMLCIIMGVIGWVGIARIVRGQILSLREQEFMIAAEATGISIPRRIFRHLVPNVMPQLIVFASMGLGEVILAEATLSFLGMGVKYPSASWGSIINAVNDSFVMTNYPFVWLPAGIFILLTVLAFNFIGDGLRDAFDPKMKR